MPQRELFPPNQLAVIEHNIHLLKNYYTAYQHKYYSNIVKTHFTPEQTRDTRFIPPPTELPHTQISIIECNPEKDIATTTHTIQTQGTLTHIYDDTGRYLVTIPTLRLEWLWQQYHNASHNTHGVVPHTQPFETEVIWLYQRYKYKNSKNNSLNISEHTSHKTSSTLL